MTILPPIDTSDPTDKPKADNVVRIRFRRCKEDLPGAPIKEVARDYSKPGRPFCNVHFFVYDKEERTIECSRCDRKFDAFEAFDHLARNWQNYDYNHRNVRGEIVELEKEKGRLAKQVSNLKAQRRRLVPNVRQDVERVGSELWRHEHEKNPEIQRAIMHTIQQRLGKVLDVLKKFGDDEEAKPAAVGAADT